MKQKILLPILEIFHFSLLSEYLINTMMLFLFNRLQDILIRHQNKVTDWWDRLSELHANLLIVNPCVYREAMWTRAPTIATTFRCICKWCIWLHTPRYIRKTIRTKYVYERDWVFIKCSLYWFIFSGSLECARVQNMWQEAQEIKIESSL